VAKLTNLRATIEGISSLPTLPVVASRINKLLENPQTTAEEVGKAIAIDPALASKVLKLVNSAFYGFPGKISTITHAIVILGFSTIKNIVLTTSIFEAFKETNAEKPKFKIEDLWLHSIACGAASQCIAKQIGFKDRETCFIAGLIHDIGKTILFLYAPREIQEIIEKSIARDTLFYETEKIACDILHTETGSKLAQHWKLPENLSAPIELHHEPPPDHPYFMISAIVHTADILVRAMDYGNGGDEKIPCISKKVWQALGMENIDLQVLLGHIKEEVEKATIFMQMI